MRVVSERARARAKARPTLPEHTSKTISKPRSSCLISMLSAV